MAEILGYCNNCLFYTQEWHLDWEKQPNGTLQYFLELDKYCIVNQVFKRPDGYCDMWETP